MNLFEEQVKQRKDADNAAFEQACAELSDAILGGHGAAFFDADTRIKGALDEILAFYGLKAREIPDEVKDAEARIEYVCQPLGVMRRRVTLTEGWYRDAVGAMLGQKRDGTVVALIPGRFGGYTFFDEAAGKRVRVNKETAKQLGEEALCFYKPFPQKKLTLKDLAVYVAGCLSASSVAAIVLITLATTLIGMLSPKITNIIFSTVLEEKSPKLLVSITVLSVCVSLSLMLVNSAKSLIMQRISTQLDISVQAATMARILSLPAGFFKEYASGDLMTRSQYVNSLCSTLVSMVLSTCLTSVFSLAYVSQIFTYAKALVVPALITTAVTVVFSIVSTLSRIKISKELMESGSKRNGMTYAMLSGVQKLKLSGSEKRAFSRWLRLYAEDAKLTYSPPPFILMNGVISSFISLASTIVMYYFAVESNVSVANYYAFSAAYGMVSGAFMSVASLALSAADIRPVLEMAKPIMDAVPEVSEDKKVVTRLSGGIELSNVYFRYNENMPYVTDGLSLKIKPGQYVAIVGKTGCGKSTLMRLLLGFETPQKGAIYYDGRDIASLDLASLRKNIGCVMQNGKLFQGDIFSNIVIAAPQLGMDDAWRAAEIAGIADDIREMPMGMFTVISEGAGCISGGQKQRLMIARAVAPSPKILLLDEATSALDNVTQKKVMNALDNLKCTRIVIAHRLSTVRQCDRIIVLDKGKIVEDGTYEELIANHGFFAELVERQRLDTEE